MTIYLENLEMQCLRHRSVQARVCSSGLAVIACASGTICVVNVEQCALCLLTQTRLVLMHNIVTDTVPVTCVVVVLNAKC